MLRLNFYNLFLTLISLNINNVKLALNPEPMPTTEICNSGFIDAITVDTRGKITIFKGEMFWVQESDKLYGPCGIREMFKEFRGPIDAAITITQHNVIDSFKGVSIFFYINEFFAYKYYRAYEVTYGSTVYFPYKGSKHTLGVATPAAKQMWDQQLVSAYFDPIHNKSNYIFKNGSALSFRYDVSHEYSKPEVTTLEELLKEYFLTAFMVKSPIDAILTLEENNTSEILLFKENKFCRFNLTPNQICIWKETKTHFLLCPAVEDNNYCEELNVLPTDPIKTDTTVLYSEKETKTNPTNAETPKTTSNSKDNGDGPVEVNSANSIRFSHIIIFIILIFNVI